MYRPAGPPGGAGDGPGRAVQIVRQYAPRARVLYVDNDPEVLRHGQSLLANLPGVAMAEADLRDPERLLGHPALRELIDLSKPVALCMTLVLHFIPDGDYPHSIVARLRDALSPGSYMVISHVTNDDRDAQTLTEITDTYNQASAPFIMRSRDDITRFFDGTELVKPGVVFLSQWRPSSESYPEGGTRWAYAGVGKKPGGMT